MVFEHPHESDHLPHKVHACIKCGKCFEACPLNLNPSQLGLLAARQEYETMAEDFHLFDCFECGSYSYVCPSNTLAPMLMAGLRERLALSDVPSVSQGAALSLMLAGMLSLAFMGFAGLGGSHG